MYVPEVFPGRREIADAGSGGENIVRSDLRKCAA